MAASPPARGWPHVRRARLTDALLASPRALLEAAGGYGKSALADEFADLLGLPAIRATFEHGDADASVVLARVARGLRRSGLSDLMRRLEGTRPSLGPVDRLMEALASETEPVLLVLEHVERRHGGVAAAIAQLTRELPHHHRSMVLARNLGPALAGLRHDRDVVLLDARALAFEVDEVQRLFVGQDGASLPRPTALAIHAATGGWAAALVLAARHLRAAVDPAGFEPRTDPRLLVAQLAAEYLGELDPSERWALAQLAHLPLVTPAVAAAAVERPGLLRRAAEVGLPYSRNREGWWEAPAPARDYLARQAKLDAEVVRRAAAAYLEVGELATAVSLLAENGQGDAAAAMLAELEPRDVDRLDTVELRRMVERLAPAAIDGHPRVLVHLARASEAAAAMGQRAEAIARGRELVRGRDDPIARELDAELARDLVLSDRLSDGETLARGVLARVGPGERVTRARALETVGRALAWRKAPDALAAAEPFLEEALTLAQETGMRSWAGQAATLLGVSIHFARGRFDAAVRAIDAALESVTSPRYRGVFLTFRADVLDACGRHTEATGDLREAREIGELLSDKRVLAYAAWQGARGASQRGETEATLALVEEVERHRGDWFEHGTGALFLADAADLLERVGESTVARAYLERAREREREIEWSFLVALGAVEARSGDPVAAERALATVAEQDWLEPRERWRVHLLRAAAAQRRGEATDAGAHARTAFDAADALGYPALPFVRERRVAERLVGLAAHAGSHAARRLAAGGLPIGVTLLGRFEITVGGRPVVLPPGQPVQVVQLVAGVGGALPVDEVIDLLWPEVEHDSGRKRLRNVLNRLREVVPDLLVREADSLVLGPLVEVDAALFEAETGRTLGGGANAARPTGAARAAAARYSGDLVVPPPLEGVLRPRRERLRRRFLALLDLLAADARRQGDLDEALRLLERAIDAEPNDDERYLLAARLLAEQGRRSRALLMLERGRRTLAALGLRPSPAYAELERSIRQ